MPRIAIPLLAGLALLASAVEVQAKPVMRSVMQDDCLLVQLSRDSKCSRANRTRALDRMKALGVDIVRVNVIRDKVRNLGWGGYDGVVAGANAQGMQPLLTLTQRGEVPSPGSFAGFARSAAQRYADVHLWSIYNEPNRRYWLRSMSARDYRNIYRAARDAIRDVDGHGQDEILLGELAPRAAGREAVGPQAFTRELFCLDSRLRRYGGATARKRGCQDFKKLTAEGFAVHPYGPAAKLPPTFRDRGDGVGVTTLGRVTRILDAAARVNRVNRQAIWDTENGTESNPPDRRAPSPTKQAEWINWSDWLQSRNSRVVTVSQYLLDDDKSSVDFNTGLRFHSGKDKPALAAYRVPIWVTRAGRGYVRVWGQVRPKGARTATILKQANGRGRFREVATVGLNSAGYAERRLRGGSRDRFQLSGKGLKSRAMAAR